MRALHDLALEWAGAHGGSGEWDADLDEIPAIYLDARGEFLVGTVGERVVAMGALRRVSDTSARITRMRVHPDHQRRGYGRRVLERLERRAAELGYSRLELDTTTLQTAAQALYASAGYVETRRSQLGPFTVIEMARTIARGSAGGEPAATADQRHPDT